MDRLWTVAEIDAERLDAKRALLSALMRELGARLTGDAARADAADEEASELVARLAGLAWERAAALEEARAKVS